MFSPLMSALVLLIVFQLPVLAGPNGTVSDWREVPIPRTPVGTTTDYHSQPVDMKSILAAEGLDKLSKYGVAGESFYARTDGLNAPYARPIAGASPELLCRKVVAQKLKKVNERLARYGAELFVLDAWRPIECQKALWQYFVEVAKSKNSRGDAVSWNKEAAKYCSDPRTFNALNPRTWTVHVTGGAVDLTLRRRGTGELLYMGGVFDDASALSETAHFERRAVNASEREAQRNRRLLYHAMVQEGFTNYPAEWWHFDYGDQMWSLIKNQKGQKVKSLYGPVRPVALPPS
ncbi:MAG: D-alanyl-D-alanine carboxypeptidase family protein [Candidatus Obscuribacterales bacterium]|nr:D-alanyl-D-alanine carboxypeptidase family protein [Candidatus Obscuribacterales bacterium]